MIEPVENPAPVLSPRERRERNREEMRRAILDAARAVMREQGVAALSLREVARRVKLQAPSLYAYFPSKMALYDALFLEGIRTYLRGYAGHTGQGYDSFGEWLRAQAKEYMRFAQEQPELYQLCFERPVPGFVPSEASLRESLDGLAGFEAALVAALDRWQISPGVPSSYARDLIIAMMHGLTSQHMANEPELPAGSGRYGSLIPTAVALFQAAWEPGSGPAQMSATRRTAKSAGSREEEADG